MAPEDRICDFCKELYADRELDLAKATIAKHEAPKATLDPRIEEIRTRYGLSRDDFWELPQKKGTWIAKHAALEVAAAKAKIVFLAPQVLEADGAAKSVALCVTGTLDERSEWSVGEASPANNKNAYPYAMAEKRAKDRVILKLIGLHGLIYSEDEADDFKQPTNGHANGHAATAPVDEDVMTGTQNWISKQKDILLAYNDLDELTSWLKKHTTYGTREGNWDRPTPGSTLDKLLKFSAPMFNDLKSYYFEKLREV
jgi:hypothetical protein